MASTCREPIAVVGAACRFPGPASSPSRLWDLLSSPYDLSREVPKERFNIEGFYHPEAGHHGTFNTRTSYFIDQDYRHFDAAFFHIHPREAETMDPQQRMLLETVYETIESAGLTVQGLQGSRTAVYVGGMSYDFRDSLYIRDAQTIPEYAATGGHSSILAARISYFFDWRGPCMSIDTACSSSLVAVHQAVQSLRSGEATYAVAAGSNLILEPEQYIALANLRMLSPTGRVHMWDASADGYARGEGFGAVILKTLSQALADSDNIQCIIRETGVSQDGKTTGITMPSAQAQTQLILQTYERAGLDVSKELDRPQFFEAHGTGTPAGDPIEAEAIHNAFFANEDRQNANPLYVGSVKTVLGHLEGAAGIAGLLKACLATQNGFIPPNLHFSTLNPKVKPFYGHLQVPTSKTPWPSLHPAATRRASVNSFGFGGTNAHAIVESFQTPKPTLQTKQEPALMTTPLVLSATSETALIERMRDLTAYIEAQPEIDLQDLARSMQIGRTAFPHRIAFSETSRDSLLVEMKETIQSSQKGVRAQAGSPRVLGIFTGQGAQSAQMGKTLLENSSLARDRLTQLEHALSELPEAPKWSLRDELFAHSSSSRLGEAALSQPLCTALQLILVDHLYAAGTRFHAVVGHSSGEIAAAYATGQISEVDAIRIAFYRGVHAKLASGPNGYEGGMMAVGLDFSDAETLCAQHFCGRLSVAASNSSSNCTISGDKDAINEAKILLDSKKVFARQLMVDTAYHSHHMQPCANVYLESLRACSIKIQESRNSPWVSSVYESDEKLHLDGAYWVENMIRPVLFSQALFRADLKYGPFDAAIEIGPHPALKGPATEILSSLPSASPASGSLLYQGTLQRSSDSVKAFSELLGSMWVHFQRHRIDFDAYRKAFHGMPYDQPSRALQVPSYPWDHTKIYHRESRLSRRFLNQPDPPHQILGSREPGDSNHCIQFRNLISLKSFPWLDGHKIQGAVVLPAMWYARATVDAAAYLCRPNEIKELEVHELDFLSAVPLEDSSATEIRVEIRKDEESSSEYCTVAMITCSAGPINQSDNLKKTFTAKIEAYIRVTGHDISNENAAPREIMNEVDVARFYEALATNGLEYTGLFRSFTSLEQRKHSARASAVLENAQSFLDVSTLDLGLQSLLAAYHDPEDGYFKPLLVPRRIERMFFPLQMMSTRVLKESNVALHSSVTSESHTGMTGEIEMSLPGGGEAMVSFEGVSWSPLSISKESMDRKMFSKTVWEVDPNCRTSIRVQEYTDDEQKLVSACDRVAWFYYRQWKQSLSPEQVKAAEPHYSRLFAFIDHILPRLYNGDVPTVTHDWELDTITDIRGVCQQFPQSADLQLIHAVGESLPKAMLDRRPMLEFMMDGEKLNEYYQAGLGYMKCYEILRTMTKRISHRFPRMKVFEVGGGTGGATRHALDALNGRYLSYTFTDVSSGFFEKAQQTFSGDAQRMFFKTFDLERAPAGQGFEEQSYDLVIGSLVLHATRDLKQTLQNVRSLLKPGGYLLLVEGSEDTLRSGFMMAGLPGWWLGCDDRKSGPMISPQRWDALLRETGYSGIDSIAKDSEISSVNLGIVFTSQATSDTTDLLRSPLSSSIQAPGLDSLTIIGTSAHLPIGMIPDLQKLLAPRCDELSSVDSVSSTSLPTGIKGPIICLSELNDPIFKGLTAIKLKGLQDMITCTDRILFVVPLGDPFSAILKGLLRSLRLEIPHLKLQVLEVDGLDYQPSLLADTFLKLSYSLEVASTSEVLYSVEPELKWQNSAFWIPRISLDSEPNHRLNSHRRKILERLDPATESLGIRKQASGFALTRTKRRQASDLKAVQVAFATLDPIDVDGRRLYLCAGRTAGKAPVLALSKNNDSIIKVPSELLIPCGQEMLQNPSRFEKSYSDVIARMAVSAVATGSKILVHNAGTILQDAIKGEMKLGQELAPPILSSSSTSRKSSTTRHISERMSRSQLKRSLGMPIVDVVLDFSEQESRVLARTFPDARQLSWKGDLRISQDELMKILTQNDSLSELQMPASMSMGVAELQDIKTTCNSPRIIDWIKDEDMLVEVKSVEETFSLFSARVTYLLLGLTGTMGRSFCEWMVSQGARNVVLTSRNPTVDQAWWDNMSSSGAVVEVQSLDICDQVALETLLKNLGERLPPIGGVVNGAMVLQDSSFSNMSFEAMLRCLGPKVDGTRYLDEAFFNTPLEFFIVMSSIAWVVGNPGQSNYSAANGYMVETVRRRRERGLAGSAMSIGVVTGVGYLSRTRGGQEREHAKLRNVMTISEEELHTVFAETIVAGRPNSERDPEVIAGLDGAVNTRVTPKESLASWLSDPRVSQLITDEADELHQETEALVAEVVPLKTQIASSASREDALMLITNAFSKRVERMLLLAPKTVHPSSALIELGVDSLVAVEIRSFFMTELKIDVPTLQILGGATIAQIASLVLERSEAISSQATAAAKERVPETPLEEKDSAYVTGSSGASVDADRAGILRRERMSYAQARMFQVNAHDPASRVNNLSWALRVDGRLDVPRFERAFKQAVRVADSLHTRFFVDDTGVFMQEVLDEPQVELQVRQTKSEEEIDEEFRRHDETAFDLLSGKAMRSTLFSLSDEAHVFVCAFHHIAVDTRSCEMFLENMDRAYQGKPIDSPAHELADFARHEHDSLATGAWASSLEYWKAQHSHPGAPLLLPLMPFALVSERKPLPIYRLRSLPAPLPVSTTRAIKAICADLKVSPYHFHLATFAVLLRLMYPSLQGDLCVGAVDSGRAAHLAHAHVFGPLFNYLALRFRLPSGEEPLPFATLCRLTRGICYAAAAHAHVPFDAVLGAMDPPIETLPATHHPLYQAQINYVTHKLEHLTLGAGDEQVRLSERNASGVDVSYDFCLTVHEGVDGGGRYTIHLQEALYGDAAVQWLSDAYKKLLDVFTERPEVDVFAVGVGEIPGPQIEDSGALSR